MLRQLASSSTARVAGGIRSASAASAAAHRLSRLPAFQLETAAAAGLLTQVGSLPYAVTEHAADSRHVLERVKRTGQQETSTLGLSLLRFVLNFLRRHVFCSLHHHSPETL